MEKNFNLVISSPNIKYTDDYIHSEYVYEETLVTINGNDYVAKPYKKSLSIRTGRKVGKVGVMLVGWGGNNGSTFTAAVLANRHQLSWNTKNGVQDSNWFGSITQASTVRLGIDKKGDDVYVPMCQLLPMVHPDDLVIDGWDISPLNLAESMVRAKVIDYDLQQKLKKEMAAMRPRPAIYDPDFIAANQADRATNLIRGTKHEQYLQIRADIKNFRDKNKLDNILVLWTANTERFCDVRPGVHDTSDNLEKALRNNDSEISPSTIFALAAIDEGCCYINGSPQNTLVGGVVQRAETRGVFVAGDDFKSGQTKLKSVLVDFLVSAGLKPVSIVSYNHLGNNDGKNLSAPNQFRSKEISKSNVVDDMVESNQILYKPGEKPDHVVVIKYVPSVGDSKRAMDEYTSEILLHGTNTIAVHNTCEDSLLAVPLMLDLVLLAELFARVQFTEPPSNGTYRHLQHIIATCNTIVHNTCEDSLLAVPLILDLVLLAELFARVQFTEPPSNGTYRHLQHIIATCNTIVHNTCEDSLLAVPLILDLVLLAELFARVQFTEPPSNGTYRHLQHIIATCNTIVHNTCEDSLLAVPLILDLVLLAELFARVQFTEPPSNGTYRHLQHIIATCNTIVHNTCEDSLLAVPLILDLVLLAELFARVQFTEPPSNGTYRHLQHIIATCNTIVHNTCEDSLLAVPLILDLVLLAELFARVQFTEPPSNGTYRHLQHIIATCNTIVHNTCEDSLLAVPLILDLVLLAELFARVQFTEPPSNGTYRHLQHIIATCNTIVHNTCEDSLLAVPLILDLVLLAELFARVQFTEPPSNGTYRHLQHIIATCNTIVHNTCEDSLLAVPLILDLVLLAELFARVQFTEPPSNGTYRHLQHIIATCNTIVHNTCEDSLLAVPLILDLVLLAELFARVQFTEPPSNGTYRHLQHIIATCNTIVHNTCEDSLLAVPLILDLVLLAELFARVQFTEPPSNGTYRHLQHIIATCNTIVHNTCEDSLLAVPLILDLVLLAELFARVQFTEPPSNGTYRHLQHIIATCNTIVHNTCEDSLLAVPLILDLVLLAELFARVQFTEPPSNGTYRHLQHIIATCNTIVHNTCEDSLLAVPLILDLVLLAELFARVQFKEPPSNGTYRHLQHIIATCNTIVHNTCEDSLLAVPLILDLVLLAELFARVQFTEPPSNGTYRHLQHIIATCNTIVHNTCEDSLLAVPLILDLVLLAELFARVQFTEPPSNGTYRHLQHIIATCNTIVHNTCEDSLLAVPLILDLVLLAELFARVQFTEPPSNGTYRHLQHIIATCNTIVHNTCEDSLLAVPLILDLVLLAELFARVQFTEPPSNGTYRHLQHIIATCNTIVHNTCEDSLLAVPLILDLVLLAELFARVQFTEPPCNDWQPMHSVLSSLSYLLKAPVVPHGAPVVNALFKQRACIENLMRACLALPPVHHMQLEHKVPVLMKELRSGAMFSASCPPAKKAKLAHENGDK